MDVRSTAAARRVVLVVVVAAVVGVAAFFVVQGIDRSDKLAGPISVVLALVSFGWMLYREVSAAPVADLEEAAERLASGVAAQWEREVAFRELRRSAPLRLRWSTTRRPVQASASAVLGDSLLAGRPVRLRLRGEGDGLAAAFRRLPARQLVVLGEPGAGKTAMAILFVLELLDTAEDGEPVPVIFSLSSWHPGTDLHTWMARRLIEDHPFLAGGQGHRRGHGADLAARLIEHGRVLPVLDGLDEMSAALHATAIEAIDRSVAGGRPLVVTCRSDEYQAAVTVSGSFFSRAAVVEIEPVEIENAIGYLSQAYLDGDERWTEVFARLRDEPEGALAEALSTPLMVGLLRDVYKDPSSDPGELLDTTAFADRRAVERRLLDRFIPAVYSPFHPGGPSEDRALRWLRFLAREMDWQRTRDLAWWRIRSLIVGPVVGVLAASGSWWVFHASFGSLSAIVGGLAVGAAGVAAAVFHWSEVVVDESRITDPRSILRRHRGLTAMWTLLAGSAVGLLIFGMLGYGLSASRPSAVLTYGLLSAATFGLATCFMSAWGSYQLSRLWFASTGRLPFRLLAFIDDAHERGVLRRAGAVHQFRHVKLQDHLADAAHQAEERRAPAPPSRIRVTPMHRLAVLALATSLVLGVLAIFNSVDFVKYDSGETPERSQVPADGCAAPDCQGTQAEVLTWVIPANSATWTGFAVKGAASRLPVQNLGGSISLTACEGARVQVTARLGDRTTTVSSGQGFVRLPDFPATDVTEKDPDRFTLSFRRVDSASCEARVEWTAPGIQRDAFFTLKRAFR
ncbi:hypothetical protein [Spirillospora sp. NPDC047279]|uniref:NACHT domain-containing protein n=1 Tax=Spirillospora sp. NPDC047279 TaxID=3155478 RepID=UPI0033F47D70